MPAPLTPHRAFRLLASLAVALPPAGALRFGDALEGDVLASGCTGTSTAVKEMSAYAVDSAKPTAKVRKIPDIGAFTDQWEKYHREGLSGSRKLPAVRDVRLRMVVGIFSTMREADSLYRFVIRSTMLQQPGICDLADISAHRPDCHVFFTFVVGKSGSTSNSGVGAVSKNGADDARIGKIKHETNLTVLDVTESMDCGKTRAWFEYAAKTWPEHATHIGKMDMDAYLDVRNLLAAVRNFTTDCPYTYGGRSWTCLQSANEYCPPLHCLIPPVGTDFFKHPFKGCWSYMQGGFYFMTTGLARDVSRPGDWWDMEEERCGPEDAVTGQAIYRWHSQSQHCVSPMELRFNKSENKEEVVWHYGAGSPFGGRWEQ